MVLSKLWNPSRRIVGVLWRKTLEAQKLLVRRSGHLIPPSQYDVPLPKRLHLLYALRVYWEIIPLVSIVVFTLSICFGTIIHKIRTDLDVVFFPRLGRPACLAHTMNLRCPKVHKHIVFYPPRPWPEMQDILDKMKVAEKKLEKKATACNLVRKTKDSE